MFKRIISKLKNRKFLAVFLLLFFAVNIFAIFNTFTEKTTSSVWEGKIASKFKKGSGSANDPYIIVLYGKKGLRKRDFAESTCVHLLERKIIYTIVFQNLIRPQSVQRRAARFAGKHDRKTVFN